MNILTCALLIIRIRSLECLTSIHCCLPLSLPCGPVLSVRAHFIHGMSSMNCYDNSYLVGDLTAIQEYWGCEIHYVCYHVVCSPPVCVETAHWLLGLCGGCLWCHVSGDTDKIGVCVWWYIYNVMELVLCRFWGVFHTNAHTFYHAACLFLISLPTWVSSGTSSPKLLNIFECSFSACFKSTPSSTYYHSQ